MIFVFEKNTNYYLLSLYRIQYFDRENYCYCHDFVYYYYYYYCPTWNIKCINHNHKRNAAATVEFNQFCSNTVRKYTHDLIAFCSWACISKSICFTIRSEWNAAELAWQNFTISRVYLYFLFDFLVELQNIIYIWFSLCMNHWFPFPSMKLFRRFEKRFCNSFKLVWPNYPALFL